MQELRDPRKSRPSRPQERARLREGVRRSSTLGVLLLTLALLAACQARRTAEPFATGLNQPRGMAFDDAGNLYVAEAGALDAEAAAAVSPMVNHRSRVVRIDQDGTATTVLDGLPFTNYVAAGDIGASDVAVLGGAVYVLTGEGYDDELSKAVLRIAPDGSPQVVASIREFVESTTPADSLMGAGAGNATNPYAMAAVPDGHALYVSDGASGRVLRVTPDGSVSIFAELPNSPPLTGLAFGPDGLLYVALFSALPLAAGNGAIWTVDPAGELSEAVPGLTMPIDVAFDAAGVQYVLEFGDGGSAGQPYRADSGRLLRMEPDGEPAIVLEGLNYPTAMAFSDLGDLYIAVGGAFTEAGQGAILRVPRRALSR